MERNAQYGLGAILARLSGVVALTVLFMLGTAWVASFGGCAGPEAQLSDLKGTIKNGTGGAPGVVKRRTMQPAPGAEQPAEGEATPAPKAPSPREQAKADYVATVRTWGRWLTGVLLLAGVACLILSFLPAANMLGLEKSEAVLVLGLSAVTPVVQYALAAWGTLAADLIAWATIAAGVAAVAVAAVVIGRAIRRKGFGTPKHRKAPA